jgi:hypothetical protein
VDLAKAAACTRVFVFLDGEAGLDWLESFAAAQGLAAGPRILAVVPEGSSSGTRRSGPAAGPRVERMDNWSGNQSRFSRIKYSFLKGVIEGRIGLDERIVCVLGPSGKSRLDTVTVHDLSESWSEEFPFDVRPLIETGFSRTIMAAIDVALDIGALGREGKPVGTIFVVGDEAAVMGLSHQAVFNPFRAYPAEQRSISDPEVVESLKEFAKLDGAIIVGADGRVEAAGRHLDAGGKALEGSSGLGARHRAAAGISAATGAVAIAVSESTGKVTLFHRGRAISTLEPLISRRLV